MIHDLTRLLDIYVVSLGPFNFSFPLDLIPLVSYTHIMMIDTQSQRSASPTGLALNHSGEEINMTVRETIAQLTAQCKTQVDLDAVVSREGDLGTMMRTHCPDCSTGEFIYEWENRKLALRSRRRAARYDEEV